MGKPLPVLARKQYNETARRPRVRTVNTLPSRTVQSDVVRAEIKHILAKYRQVGVLEHMRNVDLQFRDVSEFSDFADVMYQSKVAESAFMRLPSKVREVFHHDVAEWLDAAHDKAKLDALLPELEKLGLSVAPVAPAAAPAAPVVTP